MSADMSHAYSTVNSTGQPTNTSESIANAIIEYHTQDIKEMKRKIAELEVANKDKVGFVSALNSLLTIVRVICLSFPFILIGIVLLINATSKGFEGIMTVYLWILGFVGLGGVLALIVIPTQFMQLTEKVKRIEDKIGGR